VIEPRRCGILVLRWSLSSGRPKAGPVGEDDGHVCGSYLELFAHFALANSPLQRSAGGVAVL